MGKKPASSKDPGSNPSDKRKAKSVNCDADDDVVMEGTESREPFGNQRLGKEVSLEEKQNSQDDIVGHEDDHDDQENVDEDEDEEHSGLLRLSENFRRFSESQRELNEEDQDSEDANEEDEDDEDLMRSIHRHQSAHGIEDDDSEQDEDGDLDLGDDVLNGALRSFANRLNQSQPAGSSSGNRASSGRNTPGAAGGGGSHDQVRNALAENMARLFPDAMGLFGGLGGSGQAGQIRGLIEGLKNRDSSFLVLETLNELSERLLMMNAPMAEREIPSYQMAEAIIEVLTEPMFMEELELQLVACRCLYNFLEVNPDYIHPAVQNGAIEALQSKLLEISYIDLAEQALQALEYISRFAGSQIFRKNCLMSCLQYLDFFTIHAQRKAVTITANSVKYIRGSEFELVEEIFPILQRIVIEYQDSQLLEQGWLAISRIIRAFRSSKVLTKLVSVELLDKMLTVISHTDTKLDTNLRLIKALSSCARNDELAVRLLQSGKVGDCITTSLAKYKRSNESSSNVTPSYYTVSIETLMAAPKDLIISMLNFIINLLPSEYNSVLTYEFANKDFSSVKDSYNAFVNSIFPLLINIYSSTVIYDVRLRVMVSLIRIVSSLNDIKILDNSSLVTNLLASIVIQNKSVIRQNKKDKRPYMALLGSLILTHILVKKAPEKFISEFEREGLISDTSSLLEILRSDEKMNTGDNKKKISFEEVEVENHGDDDDENGNDNDNDNDDEEDDEENDDEEEDDYEDDYEESEEEQDKSGLYNVSDEAIFKTLTIPQILKYLTKYASDIEQAYLSKKASGDSNLEHLRLLDEITAVLKDDLRTQNYTFDDWVQVWKNFKKALGDKTASISSFELITSGTIEVLSDLFSSDDREPGSKGQLSRDSFLDIFSDETFELLIVKLQEALTRSESFEILNCGLKTSENRVQALSRQLKVKLVTDDPLDEELQRIMIGSFVALVHAISSFSTINDFLYRRARQQTLLQNGIFNAQALRTTGTPEWHLEFSLDGEVIPYESSVFGALFKYSQEKTPNFDATKFWDQTHHVHFKKVQGPAPGTSEFDERYPESDDEGATNETINHPTTISILNILKILHDFNDTKSSLFLNFKLTAKLNRQLEEALIVAGGIMPTWAVNIPRKYPFLFPMDTRIFFLQSTSFGHSRLIQLWNHRLNQDQNGENENTVFNNATPLGRASKQKLRVVRSQLFSSAYKLLDKYGTIPSTLEIEFVDEAGTGLGPTLEFYSNVSKEFLKKKLGIWRDDNEDDDYVTNHDGLFPVPIRDDSDSRIQENSRHFKYLGKFIARALIDNRIVDFNFNKVFFDIAQSIINNQTIPKYVAYEKLKDLNPSLLKALEYMKKNKSELKSMGINFTLPGYPNISLVPNGTDIYLDEENLDLFTEKVLEFTMGGNVRKQIESFINGFSEVFPYSSLLIFTSKELVELMGNTDEDWSYETLIGAIHADHGYTIDSPSVQRLITFMTKLSKPQRRLFLQFLTGSPRLPIGGFKMMRPVFTVVLKHNEGGLKSDDFLPSVMTCANYLKLPNYSSAEVLEERLMKAVNEGSGAFLLS